MSLNRISSASIIENAPKVIAAKLQRGKPVVICPFCNGRGITEGRCADGAIRGVSCPSCEGCGGFLVGNADDIERVETMGREAMTNATVDTEDVFCTASELDYFRQEGDHGGADQYEASLRAELKYAAKLRGIWAALNRR